MRKKDMPSKAQAKFLARAWSNDFQVAVPKAGFTSPTLAACVKRGWLHPTGNEGAWPNGAEFERHAVSPAGLTAVEFFLREERISGKQADTER